MNKIYLSRRTDVGDVGDCRTEATHKITHSPRKIINLQNLILYKQIRFSIIYYHISIILM